MIDSFTGENHFLSNFHEAEVVLDGVIYPTVEHAYQAAKTRLPQRRVQFLEAQTPNLAKKLGRKVDLRPDWEQVKDDVMLRLLKQKFVIHSEMRNKLIATGDQELIEGNWWGDTYWGVCKGQGKNKLGQMLMQVRSELKKGLEALDELRVHGG